MADGLLACLNDEEFASALRGWKRSPPLLAAPQIIPSPFEGRTLRSRMATPRPVADPGAIAPPTFRTCPAEFVDGLGAEALEYLGAVLKVWDADDAWMRISGLQVSGPDDPGVLVFEISADFTEAAAQVEERDTPNLARSWFEAIKASPDPVWPNVVFEPEKYQEWLQKLVRLARLARETDRVMYVATDSS